MAIGAIGGLLGGMGGAGGAMGSAMSQMGGSAMKDMASSTMSQGGGPVGGKQPGAGGLAGFMDKLKPKEDPFGMGGQSPSSESLRSLIEQVMRAEFEKFQRGGM